jgi:putative spermidine/putrescine transport system permease protein
MFDSIRTSADPVIAVVSTLLFLAVALLVIVPVLWRILARRRHQELRP